MDKEKLPKDVYAPMEAGPDKRTVTGKELNDRERSRARANAMKDYTEANSDSGRTADVLNKLRNLTTPNSSSYDEPYGKGSDTRKRQKEAAESRMKQYKKGGKVNASSRADGCAQRGKTKGKMR